MKSILILSGASYDSIVYLDKFPDPVPQTIHQSVFNEGVGSTGTGKAANLCHLGFNTTLHILFGDDRYGEAIKNFFADKPVKLLHDIDPTGTERHVNLMDKEGRRISIFVNCTSEEPELDYSKLEPEIIAADIVILNIVNYARNFIPLLRKHKKEVWTDLHDYTDDNSYHQDFIDCADYILLSSDNLGDYKSTMKNLIKGKKLVVCTHGKKGATALTDKNEWFESNIIKSFKLVDSNGAGDSFFSGFLYAHNKGYNIADCLTFGHILGGMCINSPLIAPDNISEERVISIFKSLK
jgi:sugar/nucleoside kinase (ribokinase family)